jgi:hypothetical protein
MVASFAAPRFESPPGSRWDYFFTLGFFSVMVVSRVGCWP